MTTATVPETPADVGPEEYVRLVGPEALGATPEPYGPEEGVGDWLHALPVHFTIAKPGEVAELEVERDKLLAERAAIEADIAAAIGARDMVRASELRGRQKLIPEVLTTVTVALLEAENRWHRASCGPIVEHEANLARIAAHQQRVLAEAQRQLRNVELARTHFTVQRHRFEDRVMANDRTVAALVDPTPSVVDLMEASIARDAASRTDAAPAGTRFVDLNAHHPASIAARERAERVGAR